MMPEFSKEEKKQIKAWLSDSFQAVKSLDGSEASEERVYDALSLFDDFVRSKLDGTVPSENDEQDVVNKAFPNRPSDMPETVDGFLESISDFYDAFRNAGNPDEIWNTLENSGAVIQNTDYVFVKTNQGVFQEAQPDNTRKYEVNTEPRLAMLIAHLRNDGIDEQKIYMDDLVITRGKTDPHMMREQPYNIVQIPRLDIEIAVCDQIGQTTFVKKGTVGSEFWDHMDKEALKNRDDIRHVDKHNEDQWWKDISKAISGHAAPTPKKVNVQSWSKKKPNLDMDLIDATLLAHWQATGEPLKAGDKAEGGKRGSYVLEDGDYAGMTTMSLERALNRDGARGLAGESSIAQRNEVIAKQHGFEYTNHLNQEDLTMDLIDATLLAHWQATGEPLKAVDKAEGGKPGSYILEHGDYAGMVVRNIEAALQKDGARGLAGKSSIAQRNEIIAEQYGFDYANPKNLDDLTMEKVDATLLAHWQATGEPLKAGDKAEGGKAGSYILEHGDYAGMVVRNLNNALHIDGSRGLAGTSSIAKRNEVIAEQYGFEYTNPATLEDLTMEKVDATLLAHWQATGERLKAVDKAEGGKKGSYVLEHGDYAGMTTMSLENALRTDGSRGLAGASSIAQRNEIIAKQYGFEYTNHLNQDDLTMEKVDATLLAHWQATEERLKANDKAEGGKRGSYILEHGEYAGMTVSALENALRTDGSRGLAGNSTIAQRNEIILEKYGLDYLTGKSLQPVSSSDENHHPSENSDLSL